ncbi:cell ssuface protein containing Ig-like domain protein [Deinococcus sp. QL22]|uniref:cell ssuface protein containing Ig-like domain protein n=1 Tax=Deinococcus sp. QL22 TaxID=2939437 RepID=UPI002016D9EC|nr:cell ssuface protein containing Ig-like domain protein [Deinococcus sp. QL22]UQN05934.1 cell ssuface protein containing Ig-like domain protein [Deinococcus sp. QL22]
MQAPIHPLRRAPAPRLWPLLTVALLGLGALSACGSSTGTGSTATTGADPLTFTLTSLPVGYVAESYEAPLVVTGGTGPYGFRVAAGTLPPGISLSGQRLVGKPTKIGAYKFTLETNDAGLRSKVQEYTLNVNDLPPLALTPTLPTGEIRGETRVPVTIAGPRAVRAARLMWTLPKGVTVTRVQPGENGGVLFWRQEGQTLSVSVGFKAVPRAGARVMLVSIRPSGPVTLSATGLAFEARDGTGKLLAQQGMPTVPGSNVPAAPATTGSGTTPAAAAANSGTTPASTSTTAPASPATTPPATTTPPVTTDPVTTPPALNPPAPTPPDSDTPVPIDPPGPGTQLPPTGGSA